MPRHRIERTEPLRKAELDMMMEKAKLPTRALMAMLWLFGKRISEVLALKGGDIWAENGMLYVSFQVLKKSSRKDAGDRRPFVKKIRGDHPYVKYLVDYLEERKAATDERVFPISRFVAWRRIKEINPEVYPHFFRTSLATRMAELGATEYELMGWFDWDRSQTASVYVKHTGKMAERWSRREF